jgi:uncharacterized protein
MYRPAMSNDRITYLLVDGENIDGALGSSSILGRRPEPQERPRWNKILDFAADEWRQPVRALFFINATRSVPTSFVQALQAMDYQPVLLSGRDDESVVDIAIQRTMAALRSRVGDVLLASHDADFAPGLTELAVGDRRIGLVVFDECVGQALRDVPGVEVFDLEHDSDAFDVRLPRVTVIPIDEFDPALFL